MAITPTLEKEPKMDLSWLEEQRKKRLEKCWIAISSRVLNEFEERGGGMPKELTIGIRPAGARTTFWEVDKDKLSGVKRELERKEVKHFVSCPVL